jgi:hypothetical protein
MQQMVSEDLLSFVLQTRRVLRELESDMVALRSFKNQKQQELEELGQQNLQLQEALQVATGTSGPAAVGPLTLEQLADLQRRVAAAAGGLMVGGSSNYEVVGGGQQAGRQQQQSAPVHARLGQLEKLVAGALAASVARNVMLESELRQLRRHNLHSHYPNAASSPAASADERSAGSSSKLPMFPGR